MVLHTQVNLRVTSTQDTLTNALHRSRPHYAPCLSDAANCNNSTVIIFRPHCVLSSHLNLYLFLSYQTPKILPLQFSTVFNNLLFSCTIFNASSIKNLALVLKTVDHNSVLITIKQRKHYATHTARKIQSR